MSRKYILLWIALIRSFTLFGQEVESKTFDVMLSTLLDHSVPEVSVESLEQEDVLLLDAREKAEYDVSKIQGAQWVGYDDFSLERVEGLSKDQEIVVYCSVGYRSEKITEKLREAGFQHVSNLYGGIFEWVNQGNTVVDSSEHVTPRVHAYDRVWGVWLRKGEKVYK